MTKKQKQTESDPNHTGSYNMENLAKMIDENGLSGQSSNGWWMLFFVLMPSHTFYGKTLDGWPYLKKDKQKIYNTYVICYYYTLICFTWYFLIKL